MRVVALFYISCLINKKNPIFFLLGGVENEVLKKQKLLLLLSESVFA